MFTHMAWYSRLLVTAGLVMIFYPSFLVEVAGMTIMLFVLSINWMKWRREQQTAALAI
jgi:hypothetical protein